MAFIRKIKASLVKQDSSLYTGEETYLFYDIEKNCLRVADGITPGGYPVCVDWTGIGNKPSPTITVTGDADGSVTLHELESNTLNLNIPDKLGWDDVGVPNGIASLDSYGVLQYDQLPDVVSKLSFDTYNNFSIPGVDEVLYVATDTNELYRWDSDKYILLSSTLVQHSNLIDITSTSTQTVLSNYILDNLTTKYLISVLDIVDKRFSSSEVMCSYKSIDESIRFTHFGLVGDIIPFKIDIEKQGTNLEVNITNNNSNTIRVGITRIPARSMI